MTTLTLDFETAWDKDHTLNQKQNIIQYIQDPKFTIFGVAISVDLYDPRYYSNQHFDLGEVINRHLREADPTETLKIICHNTKFDAGILRYHYGIDMDDGYYFIDTAAMAKCLNPHHSAHLGDVAKRCQLDIKKGTVAADSKGKFTLTMEEDLEMGEYCKDDVRLTNNIYSKMLPELAQREMDFINLILRMFLCPSLMLDTNLLKDIAETEKAAMQIAMEKAGVESTKELASQPKFKEILERNGVAVPMKEGKRGLIPALAKDDLQYIKLQIDHPELADLFKARQMSKSRINQTRAEQLITSSSRITEPKGLLPVPLRHFGGHTGRLSGDGKLNLQNLPKKGRLREAVTVPEGKIMYVVDYSQIEARIVAWLAGCELLTSAFRNGEDVYCSFGSMAFGQTITKDNDPALRFLAKTAVLGLGYGTGAKKLYETVKADKQAEDVDFDLDTSYQLVKTYRTAYPEIPQLWQYLDGCLHHMMRMNGEPLNLTPPNRPHQIICQTAYESMLMPKDTGLALHYPELAMCEPDPYTGDCKINYLGSKTGRRVRKFLWGGSFLENIAQSLGRHVMTYGMLGLQRELKQYISIANTVHDEIIMVCNDDPKVRDYVEKKTHELLTEDMPQWADGLPLAVEGNFGKTYAECK